MGQSPLDAQGDSVDILGFATRHRRPLVFSTVAALLLTVGGLLAAQVVPASSVVRYELTLTFPGASQGTYANGSPFSPQDIVATPLLEGVWKAQGLEPSISLSDLCRSVTIAQAGRELSQLEAEFAQKLANTKLTASERAGLEAEFQSRLDALAQTAFTISCTTASLTPEQAAQVVIAIPPEWARASESRGVSRYTFPLPQSADLRQSAERVASAESDVGGTLSHALLLLAITDDLSVTLQGLAEIHGSANTRTSDGATVRDLQRRLDAILRTAIVPACIESMAASRESDPVAYSLVLGVRRDLLLGDLKAAKEEAQAIRAALDGIASPMRAPGRAADMAVSTAEPGLIANVDGTFIDRVIEQAVTAHDVSYRRTLNNRLLEAELGVIERQKRVDFEEWLASAGTSFQEPGRQAVDGSTARLVAVSSEVAGLVDQTAILLEKVSQSNLNPSSVLYRGDIAPVVTTESAVSARTVVMAGVGVWFLLLGVSVILGVSQDRRTVHA